MKAANLDTSPRLQRVAAFLKDGKEHSTMEIIQGANVAAVNSCVAELRDNRLDIICQRKGDLWFYSMPEVLGYQPPRVKKDWRERVTHVESAR